MKEKTGQITVRRGIDRGQTRLDWLESYHTFSFGEYHDPAHEGFRSLRVINDDVVAPGQGFGEHPHRDMEIITYVIEGELQHRDSLGSGSIIKAGCVQKMSAGTGIRHSEFNPSDKNPVHLLQIWIIPERRGLPPGYQEVQVSRTGSKGLTLLGSPQGGDRQVTIHQDVKMYFGRMETGGQERYQPAAGRGVWLHVIKGRVRVADDILGPGDGLGAEYINALNILAENTAEFLLFDLA